MGLLNLFEISSIPIPVRSTGTPPGSIAQWVQNMFAVPAASVVIYGFYKFWPAMKKLANDRSDQLDEERRGDMIAMRDRMDRIEAKAEAADNRAHTAENKLSVTVSVITLLMSEVERIKPDSPVLAQAREMLATAVTGDFGYMAALNRIPGVMAERKAT